MTYSMNRQKKQLRGIVVSDAMDKTTVVEVEHVKKHPLYKRRLREHRRFKAHDEENGCTQGDAVVIEECRPLSKDKRWRIVEKI